MLRTIPIILLSAASVFARTPEPGYLQGNLILNTDSTPRPADSREKWAAISSADAQALSRQQGESWKNALRQKHLLIGLGPNGDDKLKALTGSSDPTTKMLFAQLIKTADNDLAKPLPDFYDPGFAVKKGQTAATAGQQLWMRPWGDQAVLMSVVSRISDNQAYKQRLHDLVLRLCKFPTWGTAPLNADLATAHVARGIAMAWNWNPELWSGDEKKLITDSVRSKVNMLTGGIYGNNNIWWGGAYTTNINNVSAAGAGICGVAFLNDIPEAAQWLSAAWLNFKQVANYSYSDGSSAEGTAYWTYGLSFTLQFIEASNGIIPSRTLYDLPFLKNAAEFRINASTPGFGEIISWGDSDPYDFAGPAHYLLRFASQYQEPQAKFVMTHISSGGLGGGDDVKAWAWLWSQPSTNEEMPSETDYFASSSDVINSRSGWKDDDYVFSFKSGYTNRSHSHLDAGSIALVLGSDWMLPTPRYGKGRVNGDFWDRAKGGRWKYQSNSTEANSTLVINKASQRSDAAARGTIDRYATYDDAMLAECNLSQAYDGVNTARRKIFHKRGDYIVVQDEVTLKQPGQVEWLLQSPPNGVVNDNTVNIQGKQGSATVTLLSPVVPLATRKAVSEKQDIAEVRHTLSASVTGASAAFTAVIEPKISGRETPERSFSAIAGGGVEIKTASSLEHLYFATDPSSLADVVSSVAATARTLYVKTVQDKLSEIIVTDSKKIAAGNIQLSSPGLFSAELLKSDGRGWKLTIASGKNITVKGGNIFRTDGGKKIPVSGAISSEGNYMLE